MKHFRKVIFTAFLMMCFLGIHQTVFAQDFSKDISIDTNTVRLSTDRVLEGNAVRIYATIRNNSNFDLRGTVQFQVLTYARKVSA